MATHTSTHARVNMDATNTPPKKEKKKGISVVSWIVIVGVPALAFMLVCALLVATLISARDANSKLKALEALYAFSE